MTKSAKLFLFFLLVAGTVFAQDYKGKIYATVTADSQPLPGAIVTLTSDTFNRNFVTDAKGQARFVGLDPDVYEIKIVFEGFNTIVRPNIVVDTGATLRLSFAMEPASQAEEMVVTVETPLLDTTTNSTSTVLTEEELTAMPQSRDPWSVLTTVPAVQSDRINVGGNEAGQQSNFASKGDDGDNASWVMDGVEFTDPGARGASASYLDFGSFSQIGVTTGGADASQRSGGSRLNFVTKKGSNNHTGSMRLLFADRDFQSKNNDGVVDAAGRQFSGNQVNETFEKAFEIGGPLIKDRLWYWGAFNQNTIDIRVVNGSSDKTTLENTSFKIHGDITNSTRFSLFYTNGDKIKAGRGAGVNRPRNTTWNQSGPTPIYKAEVSQLVGSNTELTLTFGRVDGKFSLTPIGSQSGQIGLDLDSGVWDNTTFFNYGTRRPTRQYELKGYTYLTTGAIENEFSYGFNYMEGQVSSTSRAGDDQLIRYHYSGVGSAVLLYREGRQIQDIERTSLYVSDQMTFGNWTVNLGLRYDDQSGNNAPSSTQGNSLDPFNTLPDLNFNGQPTPFTWETIAPRLGFTYNWGDDNQYLVRGSASIFYDTLTSGFVSNSNPAWYVNNYYNWNDANGNNVFDPGEVARNDDGTFQERGRGTQDIENPTAQSTLVSIDPNYDPPETTEFILGFEYAITPQFTVSADYTVRERDNVEWNRLTGVSRSDYVLATDEDGNLRTVTGTNAFTGRDYSLNYYVLSDPAASGNPQRRSIDTNRPDYSEDYNGLELSATKRLSNKWMLRGNIVFQDWTRNVGSGAIQDPNDTQNGANQDGSQVGVQSAGSGNRSGVWFGSSKWQGNVNGLYQLPWDVSISGNLFFRQGFAQPFTDRTVVQDADGRRRAVLLAVGGFEDERLDDVYNLDLKLSKTFNIGATRVELAAEVFNVLNDDTVLARNLRTDQRTAGVPNGGEVREIISPRIGRFSATINF